MKIAGVREIKQKFSEYLSGLHNSPVIVTKNGRPLAGIIELTNDTDLEAFLIANNPRIMRMIDRNAAGHREIPFGVIRRKGNK